MIDRYTDRDTDRKKDKQTQTNKQFDSAGLPLSFCFIKEAAIKFFLLKSPSPMSRARLIK